MNFSDYKTEGFFDELFLPDGKPRPEAMPLFKRLKELTTDELALREKAAELAFFLMGITFAVYGNEAGKDKIIPFDIIPRIVPASDWEKLERGLKQRVEALNCFLNDIYGEQKILRDKAIPESLIRTCPAFRKECMGFTPPRKIWAHISGTDLVRDTDGTFYVLEDNMRSPSGVSYVIKNREILKQTFPNVFGMSPIRPVDEYASKLRAALEYLAPDSIASPNAVVLTPGIYNSAYFEHSFLAQQMGVSLVEGPDLVVKDSKVYSRSTKGLVPVDVIYRRIDDDFLDPLVFRKDSCIGIPGLMDAYHKGNVAIANAPGCGVADDKAIYAYVPEIIHYYLGEDAIIPIVPTFVCEDPKDCAHVVANLDKMVVKAANESGGYGMLVGPHASKKQREEFKLKVLANPRNYIAQPMISLSRVPSMIDGHLEGRHVDLRPYIVQGKETYVLPGGLTRVALRKGSIVVNSSQGGGVKDTWVLSESEVAPELG
ncbi:MAG: circularly permuted type 2 ATP-grasp protein, partial [Fibrobacteraceae bacterium]|nr:circularly permuted type 2 ATP-grasp protein [Fibrobacteraceae bacterium]